VRAGAVGAVGSRQVGYPQQQPTQLLAHLVGAAVELALLLAEELRLLLQRRRLVPALLPQQRTHLVRQRPDLGTKAIALHRETSQLGVERSDPVERVDGLTTTGQRRLHLIEVGTDPAHVQHVRHGSEAPTSATTPTRTPPAHSGPPTGGP
jgi:hypothetical protein